MALVLLSNPVAAARWKTNMGVGEPSPSHELAGL
jgi:hypothetical protein